MVNALEFYFQLQSSNDKWGQIPLGLIRLGNLAVQETVKSLLQHHSQKASILRCSAFFMVQLSHPLEKEMAAPIFLPENPMAGGVGQATVHGVAKSQA